MSSTNLSSNRSLGELGLKDVKLEQDFGGGSLQQNAHPKLDIKPCKESNSLSRRHEIEKNKRPAILNAPNSGTSLMDQEQSPIDNSSFCSTSSINPAPICRQFWKSGNYDDKLNSKPTCQKGTGHLHIHPNFLHSNATSHKWAFGAVAELLDNSVDEVQNGATIVTVDKTSNPRDGTPALSIQDDGGGMDPEAMRRCLSFGFSDKKSKTAIGRYGNGFKTSSMRLGADVVVFSRCRRNRILTQSVGLLSYTFLMQTRQDRIVVPMVDYQFNTHTDSWDTLHNEQHVKSNLSILMKWSPVATECELLKHFDDIGPNGTKIIIYNLWQTDEGKLELDFDSDPEDIRLSVRDNDTQTRKVSSRMEPSEMHLANRLRYSLRAYLSILYFKEPENFRISLRGRDVKYHKIAADIKHPEFILYKPQNVEGSVITTIGFDKDAPAVNIHGFNVYHKNRLILPFWHVVTYSDSRGRGVVGILEANFIEPTHNKQEFEKTPVFQKLETRLKEMTQEYWDYHCGLIGYLPKKKPPPNKMPQIACNSRPTHGVYKPVVLGGDTSVASGAKTSFTSQYEINALKYGVRRWRHGESLKRKGNDHVVESERVKRNGVIGSRPIDKAPGGDLQHAVDAATKLGNPEAANLIQENQKLHVLCQEYEKTDEELNVKITRLKEEIKAARREYARLLVESKSLEKVKKESTEHKPG